MHRVRQKSWAPGGVDTPTGRSLSPSGLMTPRVHTSTVRRSTPSVFRRVILEGETAERHADMTLYLRIDLSSSVVPRQPLELLQNVDLVSSEIQPLCPDGSVTSLTSLATKFNAKLSHDANMQILPSGLVRPQTPNSIPPDDPSTPRQRNDPSPVDDTSPTTLSDSESGSFRPIKHGHSDASVHAVQNNNITTIVFNAQSAGEYLVRINFRAAYTNSNPNMGPCGLSLSLFPRCPRNALSFTVTGSFAGIDSGWDMATDPVEINNFSGPTAPLFEDDSVIDPGKEVLSGTFSATDRLAIRWAKRLASGAAALEIDKVKSRTIVAVVQNGTVHFKTTLDLSGVVYKGVKKSTPLKVFLMCDSSTPIIANDIKMLDISGDGVKEWHYEKHKSKESPEKPQGRIRRWSDAAPNLMDEKPPMLSFDDSELSFELEGEVVSTTSSLNGNANDRTLRHVTSQDLRSQQIDIELDVEQIGDMVIDLDYSLELPSDALTKGRILAVPTLLVIAAEQSETEIEIAKNVDSFWLRFYDFQSPIGWARVDENGNYNANSQRWKSPLMDRLQMASNNSEFMTFRAEKTRLLFPGVDEAGSGISDVHIDVEIDMKSRQVEYLANIKTIGSFDLDAFPIRFAVNLVQILECRVDGISTQVAGDTENDEMKILIRWPRNASGASITLGWTLPMTSDTIDLALPRLPFSPQVLTIAIETVEAHLVVLGETNLMKGVGNRYRARDEEGLSLPRLRITLKEIERSTGGLNISTQEIFDQSRMEQVEAVSFEPTTTDAGMVDTVAGETTEVEEFAAEPSRNTEEIVDEIVDKPSAEESRNNQETIDEIVKKLPTDLATNESSTKNQETIDEIFDKLSTNLASPSISFTSSLVPDEPKLQSSVTQSAGNMKKSKDESARFKSDDLSRRRQQLTIVSLVVAVIAILLFWTADAYSARMDAHKFSHLEDRLEWLEAVVEDIRRTQDDASLPTTTRDSSVTEIVRYRAFPTLSTDLVRPLSARDQLRGIYFGAKFWILKIWDRLLGVHY